MIGIVFPGTAHRTCSVLCMSAGGAVGHGFTTVAADPPAPGSDFTTVGAGPFAFGSAWPHAAFQPAFATLRIWAVSKLTRRVSAAAPGMEIARPEVTTFGSGGGGVGSFSIRTGPGLPSGVMRLISSDLGGWPLMVLNDPH